MLPLSNVIANHQLRARPVRAADHQSENRVLLALTRAMTRQPSTVLQQLADATRELCHADAAGISLLENTGPGHEAVHFRWVATSGTLATFAGNTMPRDFSPCGAVLDANEMLLMSRPARHYEYVAALPVAIHEVLLVPFYRNDGPIGTLWIVTHDAERRFDSEDARLVTNLSAFAAAAIEVMTTANANVALHLEARRHAETMLEEIVERHRVLEAADRDKMEFLATLSHELRNTLAPIANGFQVLKITADDGVRRKAQALVERQLTQLTTLVDDLLDIARIGSEKLSLRLQAIDLADLMRHVGEVMQPLISGNNQSLTLLLPQKPLLVRGDERRLVQVFTNLLNNAVKYGGTGGELFVNVYEEAGEVVVCVKDKGIGIEAAMLSRIFELFVQSDRAVNQSQGGLGVGLALVKRLVEVHHGSISVRSEGVGKGSEFVVRLPLCPDPEQVRQP